MARYEIVLTQRANVDLSFYSPFEKKIIVSEVRSRLSAEPSVEAVNRKRLRENPLATWELRIGKFRVFYEIEGETVVIVSVGHKVHNDLFIRGEEVKL